MPNNRPKELLQNFRITYRRIWRLVWPIQWKLFLKPSDVWKAIKFSTYSARLSLVSLFIVAIISSFFFYNSLYGVSSYRIPAKTGYIEEGLLGLNRADIANFNPLLTANSDYERRITALVYHPMYRVVLPDFNANKKDSEIVPVLLNQAPKWVDADYPDPANRFRRLRMVLRDNIKWSDGKPITIDDIKTTFDKLHDKDANVEFSTNLKDITLEVIDGQKNTFDLISPKPAPQLLYAANFTPVPRDIFYNQSITQIAQSASKFPQIVSGFYTFANSDSGVVTDPRNPTQDKKPNPFIDNRTGVIQSIILERNKYQNIPDSEPYIQYYIFQRYPKFAQDLTTDPQSNSLGANSSLQEAFLANKTGFYYRSTISSLDSGLTSEQVKQTLGADQKVIPSNTYYSLFLKSENGTSLAVKTLRKYILCTLRESDFYNNLDSSTKQSLIAVNKNKMLLPPQLEGSKDVDCGSNLTDILTNAEKKNFTIKNPEPGNGNRKVFLGNKQVTLKLVATEQDKKLGDKIQEILRNAGFVVDILAPDEAEKIKDKSSLIYFSSITAATPDVYNLYSKKSRNLVSAGANNDLGGLEDLLLDYRNTKFSDASKSKLADFMLDNFVTMTLVQGKEEYNYSPRIFGMKENLPDFTTMTQDVYYQIPRWYIDREVKSKIFG
jgi:hypothetical protein